MFANPCKIAIRNLIIRREEKIQKKGSVVFGLPCAIVILVHSLLNCRLEAVDLVKIRKYREVGYGGSCIGKF